jgi:charged multivesicular body protein 4
MFSFGIFKQTKPVQPKIDILETINKINEQLSTLEKRQNQLETKIKIQIQDAKNKAEKNNKKAALMSLQLKKIYENELNNLYSMTMQLENQKNALETASMNTSYISTISTVKTVLKETNINADKIDDLFMEIKEQIEEIQSISSIMKEPLNELLDNDELLNELDELYGEPTIELPKVPSKQIIVQNGLVQSKEDADIEKLRIEMMM